MTTTSASTAASTLAEAARLLTAHQTMVYLDQSGSLRHGATQEVPDNVRIVRIGGRAKLASSQTGKAIAVPYSDDTSKTFLEFELVPVETYEFGLKANDLFLCSEPGGAVTLSRARCDYWERFHTTQGQARRRVLTNRQALQVQPATVLERVIWQPRGGSVAINANGHLVFSEGNGSSWHLMQLIGPRFRRKAIRVRASFKPTAGCTANFYVHDSSGGVCSISPSGTVLWQNARSLKVATATEGFIDVDVVYFNSDPFVIIGAAKHEGRYAGTGVEQFIFRRIEVEVIEPNPSRRRVLDLLWNGADPFDGLPEDLFQFDLQGWNSQHRYLLEAIEDRPSLIVEVGVWKGGSVIFMANELKRLELQSTIIAVDTWLGSSELWVGPFRGDLGFIGSWPQLYYKFLSNVAHQQANDYVAPFPVDSLNAAVTLADLGLRPDVIHLDAGHRYESVLADLRAWWPVLAPGGVFIGDDYYLDGTWDDVRLAFDQYFGGHRLGPVESEGGKCRIWKSG
jgi:hypothetical protein